MTTPHCLMNLGTATSWCSDVVNLVILNSEMLEESVDQVDLRLSGHFPHEV